MYKVDKKAVFNMVRTRGGIMFHNSLRQSIRVNQFVRARENGATNMQQTVGKCGLDFDPKEYCGLGFARTLKFEDPVAVPGKVLCLPFFNSQGEFVTTVEPRRNEDAVEFLFVDLNRICAGVNKKARAGRPLLREGAAPDPAPET